MKMRRSTAFLGAILLCVVSALLSLCLGSVRLNLAQLLQAVTSGAQGVAGTIFWYTRVPRSLACLLAGAGLACAGCILQSVLGNRLASPGLVGINAGAGLGVTLCCAAGLYSGWVSAFSAFCGAVTAVSVVVLLAQKHGASRITVILSGVAMSSILTALSDAVTTLFPDAGMLGGEFRVGGFSSVSMARLIPAGILILLSLALCMTLCNELDVLSLGEETAQSLGLSVAAVRNGFLLLAALLAGASVSFAGLLGFVGLLIPHTARRLVGAEARFLLPMSALLGAGFVTLCDLAARLVFAPYELPVGILLSLIGGPFFMLLLFQRKGGHQRA